MKKREMQWLGHVTHREEMRIQKILVENLKERDHL
jgi:hypothetical protein